MEQSAAAGSHSAEPPPRLFEDDLTSQECVVVFKKKNYLFHLQITAFGDIACDARDFVMLLTEQNSAKAAADHFKKLVHRLPLLEHKKKKLRDNIQVISERP